MLDIEEYKNSLEAIQLSELLKLIGRDATIFLLQTFTCKINTDLEDFLQNPNKVVRLEQANITRTYLYTKTEGMNIEIVGYFSLSLKVLDTMGISLSTVKKLDGMDKNRKHIACYLIAQLGKNTNCKYKLGNYLLKEAIDKIVSLNELIGGRFILIDAVNDEKVINFYQQGENVFVPLEKPELSKDSVSMYLSLV